MRSLLLILRTSRAFVLGALLLPLAAHAGTIATQDVQDTQSATFASNAVQQMTRTGLSGTIKSFAIKISTASTLADFQATSSNYIAALDSCNTTACASHNDALVSFYPSLSYSPYGTLSGGVAVFPAISGGVPSSYTFNPLLFYRIRLFLPASDTLYGSASPTAFGGGTFSQQNGVTDPNIADMAIRLCDTYTCDFAAPDTTAPALGITSTSTHSSLPSITGTTTDVADVRLELNGKIYAATPSGGAWSITLPAGDELADSVYALVASSTDAAGNTGTASGSLLVDTTAPTLSIDTGP